MLISLCWLREMLPGADASDLSAASVAASLTSLGLEVESVTRQGDGLAPIVVGEIRAMTPHPDADRLTCVTLFDGTREVPVVCGASNLPPVGGRVAFAPVGVTLPAGLTIAARSVRGQASEGMICSEEELGIGPDTAGILVLDSSWAAGRPLVELVPQIQDTVLELGVTPNRPDALGHAGVARDLGVHLGVPLSLPAGASAGAWSEVPVDASLVELRAPDACGRYLGFSLGAMRVEASPLWMRVRLHRVGLRPINNVVDVTNYVLAEYGQPQHVFDRARLVGGALRVRSAEEGETLTTLDETELKLGVRDLVIADQARAQALAGVMGGAESMVTEASTEGILEVAWFNPGEVRGASKRHGLHTDSSHRFERHVDHGPMLEGAAARALELLRAHAGAEVIGRCEVTGTVPTPATIQLRHARLEAVLGMAVPADDVGRILRGLGLGVETSGEGATRVYTCTPPSFRPDLGIEVDLIEEVMRHHGLDALPAVSVGSVPAKVSEGRAPVFARADALVDAVRARGYHEHIGFAFASAAQIEALGGAAALADAVEVSNPLRSQHAMLRQSVLPSLLDAATLNASQHGRALRLFELGRTYRWATPPAGDGGAPNDGVTAEIDARLPAERLQLCCVQTTSGDQGPAVARALVVDVCDALRRVGGRPRAVAAPSPHPHLHPGVQARLEIQDHEGAWSNVGWAGELHPEICRQWDLPDAGAIFVAWVDVDALGASTPTGYEALARFPSTARDVSIELPVTVSAQAVVEIVRACANAAQSEDPDAPGIAASEGASGGIEPIEAYRGDGVPEGRKALLLRLHYRAAHRTVTDDEVQSLHETIVAASVEALDARGWTPVRR